VSDPTLNPEPIVIQVETERVEGVVDLDDVVGIVRALQEEAVRPQGPLVQFRRGGLFAPTELQDSVLGGPVGPEPARSMPPEVEQHLDAVNRLAGELAEHLAQLSRLQRPGG
jgi:hypothetical protein